MFTRDVRNHGKTYPAIDFSREIEIFIREKIERAKGKGRREDND